MTYICDIKFGMFQERQNEISLRKWPGASAQLRGNTACTYCLFHQNYSFQNHKLQRVFFLMNCNACFFSNETATRCFFSNVVFFLICNELQRAFFSNELQFSNQTCVSWHAELNGETAISLFECNQETNRMYQETKWNKLNKLEKLCALQIPHVL